MHDNQHFTPIIPQPSPIDIPRYFPSPFGNSPHPLCRWAAADLQKHLAQQTDWVHDFGIEKYAEGTNIGKMFGVLVVERADGKIGYLSAFSGKLAGSNHLPRFVPPVADMLQPGGFYRLGEEYISTINKEIQTIEQDPGYIRSMADLQQIIQQQASALEQYRIAMKAAKQRRDAARTDAAGILSEEQMAELKEQLKDESLKWQYDYKLLVKKWDAARAASTADAAAYADRLTMLRNERKSKSAALQERMFKEYAFLNAEGQTLSLREIFNVTAQAVPPSGAGDCAGPKLLQYAYLHRLRPIAMAEFWWGQPPASELRRHGHFYPACRGKCLPILGHMLQGLPVPPQEEHCPAPALNIVFQDDHIVIIDKPSELLSVPGNIDAPSVYSIAREMFPHAEEPIIVHRLDMSTSGLMVLALTRKAYHSLQDQFAARTVKKRYTALLEGTVTGDSGHITLPLRPDIDDRPRQVVCWDFGKAAETQWNVTGRGNGRTRIIFQPVTGRTHQLRVHAAHALGLNCPIVGDDLYGQPCGRLHLHASFIEFDHPISGQRMGFACDAPF